MRRPAPWPLPALALALVALAGCADPAVTTNEDARFLHAMDTPPAAEKIDPRRLMPPQKGWRWEMRFTVTDSRTRETTLDALEEIVGQGRSRHAGRDAVGYVSYNRNRVPYREEWYVDSPEGIRLLEAGGKDDRLRIEPPLLILPSPLVPERTYRWTGTIYFRGKRIPAWGLTRYRGHDNTFPTVKDRTVYCVETVLYSRNDDGKGVIHLPMSRWFVPDVGVARVWFRAGDTEYLRELVRLSK